MNPLSMTFVQYILQNELTLTWANGDGTPTVYITQGNDVTNNVTLTIENGFGEALVFPEDAVIQIDFCGLLSQLEIEQIAVAVQDGSWTSATAIANSRTVWQITQSGSYTLNSGMPLNITLSNIPCDDPLAAVWVNVGITGTTGPALSASGYNVLVQVANPPGATNLALNLSCGFLPQPTVVITGLTGAPVINNLLLYLSNPNLLPLTSLGAGLEKGARFQLSFLFDNAAQNALCSLSEATGLQLNSSSNWSTPMNPNSNPPTWALVPPDVGVGSTVLGPANQISSTVTIDIGNIITDLPAGITIATLSYWNLAGFNDGQLGLAITKVPSVSASITFTPADSSVTFPLPSGAGAVAGTLSLSVSNASFVVVTNTGYVNTSPGDSLTDTVSVTITTPTTYTLLATNAQTGQQAADTYTVEFADGYFQLPIGSILMWGLSQPIPTGWQVCDGASYGTVTTPNLTNCFILAADPNYKQGDPTEPPLQNGLPDLHTHPYSFAFSVSTTGLDGSHTHNISLPAEDSEGSSCGKFPDPVAAGTYTTEAGDGDHGHTFTITSPGLTTAGQNDSPMRPQWFSLYFIMKVA